MRHLAIGDIHGCFKALTTLSTFVPFRPDDLLITLGDYVDRGPDTCAVLDWLIAYQATSRLVALHGNHEIMMLLARDSLDAGKTWVECAGAATVASYSRFGDVGKLVDVPEKHWKFIEEQTRGWYETPTHFFVHASAYPDYSLEDQPEYMLCWGSFDDTAPHQSGKVMVCGHTSQKSGVPKNIGHAICIDTWACGTGWLTCLDVDSGQYWQANQLGETRSSWIE